LTPKLTEAASTETRLAVWREGMGSHSRYPDTELIIGRSGVIDLIHRDNPTGFR